jgi:hypothetical protein
MVADGFREPQEPQAVLELFFLGIHSRERVCTLALRDAQVLKDETA